MALTVLTQTLEVSEISATVITPVVLDSITGDYVREYRYYGPSDSPGGSGPLILTIRVKAGEAAPLQYQTGSLTL